MNSTIQRLMAEAMRQTGSGNLDAATATLQRVLRGDFGMQPPGAADDATPAPGHDDRVIDVSARLVDDAPAPVVAGDAPSVARAPAEPAAARPVERAPERWEDAHFSHGGRTLAYKLYVPPRAANGQAPRALVLMLHGCTQDPADFAAGTRMNELGRLHDVAVLYPAQTQHANSQRCWNWFKPQHQRRGRGEPALLASLAQAVAQREGIDASRLYVAGLSAGGAMADILGRAYPDVFAAVGVHSGLPTGAAHDLMSALSAMRGQSRGSAAVDARQTHGAMPPVIVFHGDADGTVHPSNGEDVVGAALGDAGGAQASVTRGKSGRGKDFVRSVHPATAQHADVEHWLLRGGGHAWSGGSQAGSYTDASGADASAEMLRFFLDHPLARP